MKEQKGTKTDLQIFDESRKIYPGTKRGSNTEFINFCKHKDWKEALFLLVPAIKSQTAKWQSIGTQKKYIPHFKTWINQRQWEECEGVIVTSQDKELIEQKAIERKKNEKRQEYSGFINSASNELLIKTYKNNITMRWLIDEIRPDIKAKAEM